MAKSALARRAAPAPVRRRTSNTKVMKLEKTLQSTRRNAKVRERKARTGHVLTQLAVGAASGFLARKDIELPWGGELGTDTVAALGLMGIGYWARSDFLLDAGTSWACIAVHEFVEDSPALAFLDT